VTPDRLFLNASTLMHTPTARVLEAARAAGFAGVEARAERLLEHPEEGPETRAAARPGEVLNLNGVGLPLDERGRPDLGRLDGLLEPRLRACEALGTRVLLAVPPVRAGLGAADRDAVRDALEHARARAAAAGVSVWFEFLGLPDCPVNTPALAAETVGPLPGVGLVIDAWHWHLAGAPALEGFPVDRLGVVHVNDAPDRAPETLADQDRLLPGEGAIDLARLARDLERLGYAGPYSVETFNPAHWAEDPAALARRALAASLAALG
jgi:2-keto-myo-inositol isomerase